VGSEMCIRDRGTGVGANDAELLLRSLATMPLRYQAQDKAARALATWCAAQSAFSQVLHPALNGAPGHAHWQPLCVTPEAPEGLAAGIFSVVMDERFTPAQVDAFCDAMQLFKIGYSWGGPMSLVMPYNMASSRARVVSHMQRGRVVRFCIGLEDVADLQNDLATALRKANMLT
jgi:cystathionine beta-lyase